MGSHRFPIRTVAREAGVSAATVDRVLNDRGGVRATTVARVNAAIAELDRRQDAFELGGRTFTVDLVMQAPRRFTSAVWDAFDDMIPAAHPAAFRMRPHLQERVAPDDVVATLDSIIGRGSHAVVLKAPDTAEVVAAVDRLAEHGIPVFTIVTDLPTSRRTAYVGLDNRAAGATAAYLIDQWLRAGTRSSGSPPATVLVTISSRRFFGEEERIEGFRSAAATIGPDWHLVQLAETQGLDAVIEAELDAVAADTPIDAVYSIGGGNLAVLDVLDRHANRPAVFVAHDLDGDNRDLLRRRRLSAVLHHDLHADAARTLRLVMQAHGAVPGQPATEAAPVHVVTPYNIPGSRNR